jgi:putative ABC transport system ATP-binding protein
VALLSGGEQQRIAVAAGIATGARLLLVDEPTAALDAGERDSVISLLEQVNNDLGTTVVVVTHDVAVAGAMGRTVTIRDGRIGAEGRHGEEYAVVGRDGSVQLPPDVLAILPPDSLVRIHRHPAGVDLRNPQLEDET